MDNLKNNSDRLPQETVDAVVKKFQDCFRLLAQQKLELEQIVLRTDGCAEHLKLESKWITETHRILMEASALPQSVEKQMNTIEVLSLLIIH